MTHSQKKRQSIDTNSEIIKISDLLDKDLRVAIIMINEVNKNTPVMSEIREISAEKCIIKNNQMESFRIKTYNRNEKFTG